MSDEPESPVETPAPPPAEEDVPDPTPPTEEPTEGEEQPEEETATPATVEPKLGFAEFVSVAPAMASLSPAMRAATQAALRRFMRMQRLSPEGYYATSDWHDLHTRMRAHT